MGEIIMGGSHCKDYHNNARKKDKIITDGSHWFILFSPVTDKNVVFRLNLELIKYTPKQVKDKNDE